LRLTGTNCKIKMSLYEEASNPELPGVIYHRGQERPGRGGKRRSSLAASLLKRKLSSITEIGQWTPIGFKSCRGALS